jgi:NitT/TauT family transport system substrate-binding protein
VVTGIGAVVLLAALGGWWSLQEDPSNDWRAGVPDGPRLTVYTAATTTTPQLGLWSGLLNGDWTNRYDLRLHLWKDMDDLQASMLAGRGDIWVGHLEGFALAARRGAPVVMLAVTGWKKFYIMSRLDEIQTMSDLYGRVLAYTPVGNPAVPLLQSLLGDDAAKITFQPQEARQLGMLLMRGDYDAALAPEPLVSMLLARVPDLRVVLNVEEFYGKQTGRAGRVPLAGIAVNRETLERHPTLAKNLLQSLFDGTRRVQQMDGAVDGVMPPVFSGFVSPALLHESLSRDLLHVEAAADVKDEIRDYFAIVIPALVRDNGTLDVPEGFMYNPDENRQ